MSGFQAFGLPHILWLCVLAVTGTISVGLFPARGRDVGPVLAVLGRILPGLYEMAKGTYGLSSLPLHVCAMAGYGCFLHRILTSGKTPVKFIGETHCDFFVIVLGELLFFPGLPGAILALFFPGWGYLSPFSLLSICEFLGHFGIVLYVFSSIREKALCPSRRRAFIPICFCFLYFGIMLPFDRVTGMNYGFLLLPAPDSPLSWIDAAVGDGAGYYMLYALLVLGVMGFCYRVAETL